MIRRTILVDVDKQYGHRLKDDMSIFFKSESQRINKLKYSLIEKNHGLGGYDYGFIYDGRTIVGNAKANISMAGTNKRMLLHESLEEEAKVYLDQFNRLISDVQQIMNLFSAAAVRCKNEQDYRDAFPDALWESNAEIMKLPRTREPGFNLSGFRALERQFETGINLLHYHRFNKLVF